MIQPVTIDHRADRHAAQEARHGARRFGGRDPAPEQRVDRGQHRRLADAHRDAHGDQRRHRQRRRRRRQQREQRPGEHRGPEHASAPVARGEPAAREHEQQVADEERGEDEALLGLGPAELLLHRDRGDRDVDPVGIGHHAGEEGHGHDPAPSRAERSGEAGAGHGCAGRRWGGHAAWPVARLRWRPARRSRRMTAPRTRRGSRSASR